MKSLLNVGSDGRTALPTLSLNPEEWTETHFDIREVCPGSVVGDVMELDKHFEPETFDVVMCSHMLEHIDPWNVLKVLHLLKHPVKRSGQVVVIVPDIEAAANAIVQSHSSLAEMYDSVDGLKITARDMFYGYSDMVKDGIDSMRHRCAFTANDLAAVALAGGLSILRIEKRPVSMEVVLVYQ